MNILFVCSGNTCRSPMAEGYLNAKKIRGITAFSCGFISEGDPVSENAVTVMNELGIDISNHKSRLINKERVGCADKIYCMGESHKTALLSAGVLMQQLEILGGGIPDPFGQSIDVYRSCRDKIIASIDGLLYGGKLSPVKILPADKDDAGDIAKLEKECFALPWSENAIVEAMQNNTAFFKALYCDVFAGYISVTAVAGEGYINNIAVTEKYRETGVGTALIDRTVSFAREKNLEFLSLEVRESNEAAISLYLKLGFNPEGKRKNFYDNPKEDGLIMTRRFKV